MIRHAAGPAFIHLITGCLRRAKTGGFTELQEQGPIRPGSAYLISKEFHIPLAVIVKHALSLTRTRCLLLVISETRAMCKSKDLPMAKPGAVSARPWRLSPTVASPTARLSTSTILWFTKI